MSARLLAFATTLVAAMAAASAQSGEIAITHAWARATPAGAAAGAAYLTIVSPVPDRLVAVSSPVAKQAGLHTMTMAGGIMKMRPLDAIDLPAGRKVTLKPGSTHIMLTGLAGPLKDGQNFVLTLDFAKAGARQVTVAVGRIGAMGPPGAGADKSMPMPATH